MSKLESITPGSRISGPISASIVQVLNVTWYGNSAIEVLGKDDRGNQVSGIIYRAEEDTIHIVDEGLPWSFDISGDLMRLVSEAYRINLAHIFDPYLAIHTSSIEPLPHQISAVYQEMLPKLPLRYVLADDPGAGKTIMTGLLLKELIARGDLKRCLIVSPGSLSEQWQDELYRKFNLRFEILTNDRIEAAVTGNVFEETNFCIARLDKLSRSDVLREKLRAAADWDLVVVDEAHKLSATVWGNEVKYTKRFLLGRDLSEVARNFLLLTATPHNGKDEDFQLFMSLIDQDRFEGVSRNSHRAVDVSDVMRRLVKEELLKFDGKPLFPERIAYTVNYDLSPQEAKLYSEVTSYVQEEFNRADNLSKDRKSTVGFALTILQRRLASSPEAIYQSLHRRRERLESRLNEEMLGKRGSEATYQHIDDYDEDDLPSGEIEDLEEKVADQASAATTITELQAEIRILKQLEDMASKVRASGEDRKWDELSSLLQENKDMFDSNGQREKLIIFTEHKDTLRYLSEKIRSLFGSSEAVVTIHGGMLRDERRKVEELFKQDKEVRVLIATDAAGEGINLQRAHLMVNYDLPWNPNRLEQRFGRIHRIGQMEVCHLWNLVARETREGVVFQRLFEKLEEERQALGGKVFDILGKMTFNNRPLRELLVEAVRYGNDPKVRAKLEQIVDNSFDAEGIKRLLEENALTEDTMDVSKVMEIREDMERAEAHKLQPHFIGEFFIAAFTSVGGKIRPREKGRYEITSVPAAVRNRDRIIGFGEPVLPRYERVCFDKEFCNIQGLPTASLLCPGHPLLEATIDLILERHVDVMKRGAVFVDDSDFGTEARILFYIEDSIRDGVLLPNGNPRVISRNVHFVEIKENGEASNAGYAPYLDYRAVTDEEAAVVHEYIKSQKWLTNDVERTALNHAIVEIIPEHFAQVKSRKAKMLDKTAKAVKDRLTSEIQYWDFRAAELKQKEDAGKASARLNSSNCERRAEDLQVRLQKRMSEIESEKMIAASPPIIMGGALIIPKGLMHRLTGAGTVDAHEHGDRQAIEYAAMKAVMDIERRFGFEPKDVSGEKCGYDILSTIPMELRTDTSSLRFIEVKGRKKGATTVTISKNEILTGLNKSDEYILAIVEVDGDQTHTVYLRSPFTNTPDWAATSVTFDIADLLSQYEIIYQE